MQRAHKLLYLLPYLLIFGCGDDRNSTTSPSPGDEPDQAQEDLERADDPQLWEADFDWHNIFEGQFWRIEAGRLEAEVYQIEALDPRILANCLANFGLPMAQWSHQYQIKESQLVATALTESGCQQLPDSSDGLSAGIMQVTGRTCNNLLRIHAPDRVYASDEACRLAMADSAELSIELAAMYIADDYQRGQSSLDIKSFPYHLDPIKVAAGYNAGSLKESRANDWHLLVTGNHLDRYANAYNGFVNYQLQAGPSANLESIGHQHWQVNQGLPRAVESRDDLDHYRSEAREGDAIFVGDWPSKTGYFAFFIDGDWLMANH